MCGTLLWQCWDTRTHTAPPPTSPHGPSMFSPLGAPAHFLLQAVCITGDESIFYRPYISGRAGSGLTHSRCAVNFCSVDERNIGGHGRRTGGAGVGQEVMTLRTDPLATEEQPLPFPSLLSPPHPLSVSGVGAGRALCKARARVLADHIPFLPFAVCLSSFERLIGP